MAINLEALYMFRAATNWTEDGIANLDGEHAIKKNGEYGGAFTAIGRARATSRNSRRSSASS